MESGANDERWEPLSQAGSALPHRHWVKAGRGVRSGGAPGNNVTITPTSPISQFRNPIVTFYHSAAQSLPAACCLVTQTGISAVTFQLDISVPALIVQGQQTGLSQLTGQQL